MFPQVSNWSVRSWPARKPKCRGTTSWWVHSTSPFHFCPRFNKHLPRHARTFTLKNPKGSRAWFHFSGCLVNLKTRQRHEGWWRLQCKGEGIWCEAEREMWMETALERNQKKMERGHKHRLVNNEGEQRFCAHRKPIAQKSIFSPPCTLRLVSTVCDYTFFTPCSLTFKTDSTFFWSLFSEWFICWWTLYSFRAHLRWSVSLLDSKSNQECELNDVQECTFFVPSPSNSV